MREILYRGKRKDNGEWMVGFPIRLYDYGGDSWEMVPFNTNFDINHFVIPETIGQYTGMHEFVASDKSFDKPLFEGDIVEVWSNRSPKYTRVAKSQYDGDVVVRATICFRRGSWTLDYDNKYNEELARLRGKEEDERAVDGSWDLYHYSPRNSNEEWLRKNSFKWCDIKKIGTVFENSDLLEG